MVMRTRLLLGVLGILGLVALAGAYAVAADPGQGAGPSPSIRERIMNRFDTDGDGTLGAAERAALVEAAKARFGDRAGGLLQKFDDGDDAALNEKSARETFRQGVIAKLREIGEKVRAKVLEKFDTDGDGKLGETERAALLEAAKKRFGDKAETFIQKHDTDNDGQLNDPEWAAAVQDLRSGIRSKSIAFVKQHDTDGDGQLDAQEREDLKADAKARFEQLKARFQGAPAEAPAPK
jgi:Ca2+-binding EF-hand superfamily protein